MKIRVVHEKTLGSGMFTVQMKIFGFWVDAFHINKYLEREYFKSPISAEKALEYFTSHQNSKPQISVVIEEHEITTQEKPVIYDNSVNDLANAIVTVETIISQLHNKEEICVSDLEHKIHEWRGTVYKETNGKHLLFDN